MQATVTGLLLLNRYVGRLDRIDPIAHLPFELPSYMREVQAQRGDVPHDTARPLYPYGYGIAY